LKIFRVSQNSVEGKFALYPPKNGKNRGMEGFKDMEVIEINFYKGASQKNFV
jgi:hypothetical protein